MNKENDEHLFALYYIYIPRINTAKKSFQEAWNNHKIQSTKKSPMQLYNYVTSCRLVNLVSSENSDIDESTYEIDDEGPVPCIDDIEQINMYRI